MAWTLNDIKEIVKVVEQITTFTGANVENNEVIYNNALLYLLNKGLGGGGPVAAIDVTYDNLSSGIPSANVQGAIDDLKAIIDSLSANDIAVVPSGSLTDTDVQAALQTIFGRVDANETRIGTLEDTYVKATNFEIISSASGSITIPTGGTILLNEFNGTIDALVSEIDGSNTPTWEDARDAAGDIISVATFDVAGNYTLDRTPTGNIALIYVYRVQRKNLDWTKTMGFETLDLTKEQIKAKYEGNLDTNAFTDADKTKLDGIATGAEVNVNSDWSATSGDAEILNKPTSWGNYAQTVQSATINTAPEQSIIGTGVGSLSIPANAFSIGDSFHGKMGGVINATGGGGRSEITIRIKTGTTVLASTGVFDLDNATNQGWEIELDFTLATIGAAGDICTNGNFAYTKDGSRQVFGYIFQDVQPIDTTISNTLDITVEWNVLNGGDDIYSANFVLYKVY